jgi:CheY-like chemotaxis protein
VSKKILIVEDEADIRAALVAWFEEEGFETTEPDNGIGGLLEYERSQPAIALLYMDMPGMNGVELCSRIRALSPIPLVMFTVAADVGKVEAAIEEGATDWILKHNGFDALIDRITEHLNVERRSICEADFDQGVAAQILTTPERDMSSAGHRIDIDQVGEFDTDSPTADDLWTWSGEYFGFREGSELWTQDGRHAGRFRRCSEIFRSDGLYMGVVMDGRLVVDWHSTARRASSFTPSEDRIGHRRFGGRTSFDIQIGFKDFPSADSSLR